MAWLILLVAFVGPAVPVYVSYLLGGQRLHRTADWQAARIEEIHVLVNSRMSEALDHISRLEARLIDVGERTDDLKSAEVRTDLGRRADDLP